uniref:Cytochrome p450 3049E2 n=2 Tax=Brachionus TaxID=10194 RepID=W8RV05_9BILA|nr:cytochrome p450 3049E2 [Brachionus koreanus]
MTSFIYFDYFLLLLLVFSLWIVLKFQLMRKKYNHLPSPKTNNIVDFFFGQYFTVNKFLSENNFIENLQLKWSKRFGSVYVYQFINQMICVTSEEDAIKKILIEKDFPKKPEIYKIVGYPFGERFLGRGLVTEIDKEKWRKRRSLFNHGFKKNVVSESIDHFNSKGNILIEKLNKAADLKGPICIFDEFNRMALDAIAKIAFDLELDSINKPESKLNGFIGKGLHGLTLKMTDPLIEMRPEKRNLIKDIRQSIRNLRKFSAERLTEIIKDFEETSYMSKTILSNILSRAKSNDDLDFELLIDDFVTFFIAGQETTANALTFCIFELGQNEQVLNKLKIEIESVLGGKKEISNEDVSRLVYTNAVFKEALRKWPPIAAFSRTTTEEIEICGKKIPANTWFYVSPFVMARSEKYFPQPDEFIPERFLNEHPFSKENKITSYTYFPFSLGPRNCIGQNFAMLEGKLVLAKFIQHFDFILDPNQSLNVVERTTLKPVYGV